jgi:DNA phosphorothioation-dependent restriction protein DptH
VITEIETLKANIRSAKTDIKPESLLFHKYRFKIVEPTDPLPEGVTGITGIETPEPEPDKTRTRTCYRRPEYSKHS